MLRVLVGTAGVVQYVAGHGALGYPPSRQHFCSGGPYPNRGLDWSGLNGPRQCHPEEHSSPSALRWLISNWPGVNKPQAGGFWKVNSFGSLRNSSSYDKDPRGKHIATMGGSMNASICSANRIPFRALEESVWSKTEWKRYVNKKTRAYPTKLNAGASITFKYAMSAPHRTFGKGYIDIYITKPTWEPGEAVTWNHLQKHPFCRYTGSRRTWGMRSWNNIRCTLPNITGQYVIYTIWQRDDSPEAFYSCADVILGKDGKYPEDHRWKFHEQVPTRQVSVVRHSHSRKTSHSSKSPRKTTKKCHKDTHYRYELFDSAGNIQIGKKCLGVNQDSGFLEIGVCSKRQKDKQSFESYHRNQIKMLINEKCWSIDRRSETSLSSLGRVLLKVELCEPYSVHQMFTYDTRRGRLQLIAKPGYCVEIDPDLKLMVALPCDSLGKPAQSEAIGHHKC